MTVVERVGGTREGEREREKKKKRKRAKREKEKKRGSPVAVFFPLSSSPPPSSLLFRPLPSPLRHCRAHAAAAPRRRPPSCQASHHKQYPPGTTTVYSYFESRGGRFQETVFFGLQYLIKVRAGEQGRARAGEQGQAGAVGRTTRREREARAAATDRRPRQSSENRRRPFCRRTAVAAVSKPPPADKGAGRREAAKRERERGREGQGRAGEKEKDERFHFFFFLFVGPLSLLLLSTLLRPVRSCPLHCTAAAAVGHMGHMRQPPHGLGELALFFAAADRSIHAPIGDRGRAAHPPHPYSLAPPVRSAG